MSTKLYSINYLKNFTYVKPGFLRKSLVKQSDFLKDKRLFNSHKQVKGEVIKVFLFSCTNKGSNEILSWTKLLSHLLFK